MLPAATMHAAALRATSKVTCRACKKHSRLQQSSFVSKQWLSSKQHPSRQWSTPLAKTLANAIEVTGPITVAAYMRQCLTSPDGGYYMTQAEAGHDQFGQKGDFVTSPEISQIFGELVGIWFLTEWMAQGKRSSGVTMMEIGPGRGTLMDDMLRTIQNFPDMASSIETIYLVEASPTLRLAQKNLLCGEDAQFKNLPSGGIECHSKYLNGVKIQWYEDIRLIQRNNDNETPLVVAHEFFDALPIHIFQSSGKTVQKDQPTLDASPSSFQDLEKSKFLDQRPAPVKRAHNDPTSQPAAASSYEWREMVITPAPDPDSMAPDLAKELPEFELSLSPKATPHSMYLPEISQRYKALKQIKDSIVEISPESLAYAADIAVRIGGPSPAAGKKTTLTPRSNPLGAALILDYGTTQNIPANSLRGIRNHKPVSPLSSPGAVDVSADVDFLALANAALEASPGVVVHGPMEQGRWLEAMGISARAEVLMKSAKTEKEKHRIEAGWNRLVDRGEQGMGRIYKAMAILPFSAPADGKSIRRPVGFGGDVPL